MMLKELILSSFGKFNNKSLVLEKGVNIVYGNNEAGKTTVHKFIEGMFFGFFRQYSKRRMYSDDYDRYFPWNQNEYNGVLKYMHNNNIYRIERNFIKGNDEVKIFDEKTGEDITYLFEYDNTTRLHQPSSVHLDLNNIVFSNTISIKQLGTKTEDGLAKEVKDSLINLGGSLDEDISIKKVMEKLDKRIDEIGTKARIKTSPYGKIVEELATLGIERKKAHEVMNEIKEHQERLNNISEELQSMNTQKEKIQHSLVMLDIYEAKHRYNEAVKLIEEIDELEKETNDLKKYSTLSYEDYTEVITHENTLKELIHNKEALNEKYNKITVKLRDTSMRLKELESFSDVQENDCEKLTIYHNTMEQKKGELEEVYKKIQELSIKTLTGKDAKFTDINENMFMFEELEDEKNRLIYNNESSNLAFLTARLEEKQKSLVKFRNVKIASIFLELASIICGLIIDPVLYFASILPVALFFYSVYTIKEVNSYTSKLNSQITEIEARENEKNSKIEEIDSKLSDILNKYECSSKSELRKLANEHAKNSLLLGEKLLIIEELKLKKNQLIEEIQVLEDKIKAFLILIQCEDYVNQNSILKFKQNYSAYLETSKLKKEIQREQSELCDEIKNIEARYKEIQSNIATILEKNKVNSISGFKKGLDNKSKFDKLMQVLDSKNSLLKRILGDNSIEFLMKNAEKYKDVEEKDMNGLDKPTLGKSLKQINEHIINKREEFTRLEEKIKNLYSTTKPLVFIEEEITRKTKTKNEYENKLSSLELAKETIDRISKNIQRDFAPRLNKEVGKILADVTGNRYGEVKINEALDIKVIDPSSNKLIDIEKLSGGTIDQIYFATRFGIVDIIKGENKLPLILDDCFIQYDIERLSNIMSFLINESLNRQIILFTCHTRERELLDTMNVSYNYVQV